MKTRPKCQAVATSTDQRCKRSAMRGARYCWHHFPKSQPLALLVAGAALGTIMSGVMDGVTTSEEERAIENRNRLIEQRGPVGTLSCTDSLKGVKEVALELGDGLDKLILGTPAGYLVAPDDDALNRPNTNIFEDFKVWIEDEQLKITATIRDVDGVVIAKLLGTTWQVAEGKFLDRNADTQGIEVIDSKDNVILQADFKGIQIQDGKKRAIVSFRAIFRDAKGNPCIIGLPSPNDRGISLLTYISNGVRNDVFVLPSDNKTARLASSSSRVEAEDIPKNAKFERIFEYPSRMYPGKRVNPRK